MSADWREIDERLIRRGEFILELGFVDHYWEELKAMNRGRRAVPTG